MYLLESSWTTWRCEWLFCWYGGRHNRCHHRWASKSQPGVKHTLLSSRWYERSPFSHLGFFSSHVPSWQITWRQGSEDAAMTQLERKDAIFVLTWERVTGRSFPISFISFQDLETEVWASSLATWLRKIRRNSWLWLGCFASIRWEQTKQLFSICLEDAKQLLGTWLLGGTGSLAVGVIFVDRSSPRSYLMTCSLLYWANEEKKQWSITPRKAFLSLINN